MNSHTIGGKEYRQYIDTHYYVSSDGDIWSEKQSRSLTQKVINSGYYKVMLYKPGVGNYCQLVHRMVAICWVPNPDGLNEVNHKDSIKSHNCDYNLEWCTHSHNIKHMSANITNPISNIKDRTIGSKIANGRRSQPVECYCHVYASINEASRMTNISTKSIRRYLQSGINGWRYCDGDQYRDST